MHRYDIRQTYDWNYEHSPGAAPVFEKAPCPGSWDFCGLKVDSPLGVPAGPLLNSAWILYYAGLGFSVLTYKTVRSRYRACYGLPNLLPVRSAGLDQGGRTVVADPAAERVESWAISFGMPSKDPARWREDVARAREGLAQGQVLSVSVVASPCEGWSVGEIAADFRQLAAWARDAGAQAVEANLSCPNVVTAEGQLYQSPEASRIICEQIREAADDVPLVLKIGLFERREQAEALIEAVAPYAAALSTVNSMSAYVEDERGNRLFEGAMRGIGGACIRERSNAEVAMLAEIIRERGLGLKVIGVGGIKTAADVKARLAAGAHHVQIATAAMLNPLVALEIRRELASA
jgi:dihydroorotate dehydrogenase